MKTRVVCFFFDKDEYKEEIRKFREEATELSQRNNLRIGIVTDSKMIKRLKNKHSVKYFPVIGFSSCSLRRYDGQYIVHDITSAETPLKFV
jgi:tRNA nucleotidyltransferase/poly(A) polymerase